MKPPYTDTKKPGSPIETPYTISDTRRLSMAVPAVPEPPVDSKEDLVVLCELNSGEGDLKKKDE